VLMDKINLSEYAKLKSTIEYDSILKHLKPSNSFGGGKIDFNKLTYKDVRSCLHLMKEMKDWDNIKDLFCLAYGIDSDKFWKVGIDEYYSAQNHLIKAFTELQERESKLLQSINADAGFWEMAGGARLNKFSNLMPLVQLGEIYHIYPYEMQNKIYNEILTLLVLHKEKAEVSEAYSKLKQKR
jgi:hypothetical protein